MKRFSNSLVVMLFVLTSIAIADDGQLLVRNLSPKAEQAFIQLMNFYVPAQRADGSVQSVAYFNSDQLLVKTEFKAKPLIGVYLHGPVIRFDDLSQSGFPGHGRRDAYAAVSLDDGETWSPINLSNSADKSSYTIPPPGILDPAEPSKSILTDCQPGDTLCLTDAIWTDVSGPKGQLYIEGFSDTSQDRIEIVNGMTGTLVFYIRSKRDGSIVTTVSRYIADNQVPCSVQAITDTETSNIIAVANAPSDCVGDPNVPNLITEYPGDVTGISHALAGNRVLVAWQSKYCTDGFPAWSSEYPVDDVANYLGIDNQVDLYLIDLFGVDGPQSATDYTELAEFDGEYDGVGVVPYSCLWAARGVLRENPVNPGTTELVWFQAERLSSGRRDVNRIETACVTGAGCAVTWQEDPEGLQPETAGAAWDGATTHRQTDIWYSFIEWEDFDIITDNAGPIPLADNILDSARPMPYVPMMVAARLTNNAHCEFPVTGLEQSYCNAAVAADYGIVDQCVGAIEIPLGAQDTLTPICVVDTNKDGAMDNGDLPNLANTAASRARLNLQPRDTNGDGVTDDAWIIIVHEEDKGLGQFGFYNDVAWDGNLDNSGVPCTDPDANKTDPCIQADIGKNQWYISFALGTPQTSVLDDQPATDVDYSLLNNLVGQQNQYNAPEVNWITGSYFPPMSTEDMWDFADLNFLIFNTEISRRGSLIAQPLGKALASESHLVAMPLFREGIINPDGPADIMARRIVLRDVNSETGTWRMTNPDNPNDTILVEETEANPYDFRNLACQTYDGEGAIQEGRWEFTDGSNPYYPKGLCLAASLNLSARTPYTCEVSGLSDGICPGAADMICIDNDDFGPLCSTSTPPDDVNQLDKLSTWYQCPGWNGNSIGGVLSPNTVTLPLACYQEPDSQLLMNNLDDRSWYMPIETANIHNGFLDGDFVKLIYTWSPNWKLNVVGIDHYELYSRRSFDGGVTWTTTPSSFVASDGLTYSGQGTTTCETWRDGDSHVCTAYSAGEAEQSCNVSQLINMRGTVTDAVITPTIPSMPVTCPDWYQDDTGSCISEWLLFEPITNQNTLDGDATDVRNPSRDFIVFETADNTTAAYGEPEPLNLYYGRGELFDDHFTVWAEVDTGNTGVYDCYPTYPYLQQIPQSWGLVGTGFCNEFDTLEGLPDLLSKDPGITASAHGDFLYAVWSQFNLSSEEDEVMFRRVWYLDGYSSYNPWSLWTWALPPGP